MKLSFVSSLLLLNHKLNNNIHSSLRNYIKSNIETRILKDDDISWEHKIKYDNVINKYFKKENNNNNNNNYCKNLIIMFDAGPIFRKSFYKNFKNISIKNANNLETFLII